MTGQLRFISISSGSAGNCCLLQYIPDTVASRPFGLVIDAGISLRRLKRDLTAVGLGFDSIDAVLITHDHFDHIRHLGSWCKRLKKPVYATATLHAALSTNFMTRDHIAPCRKVLQLGEPMVTGPFSILAFEVPHDATQTVGFAIKVIAPEGNSPAETYDYVHITDCGKIPAEAIRYASHSSTVTIESNYDMDMLLKGKYHAMLKSRIRGGHGHMSNDECAEALKEINHPGLKHVFLCHLSHNNNTPQLAVQAASQVIDPHTVSLRALPRQSPTPLINL